MFSYNEIFRIENLCEFAICWLSGDVNFSLGNKFVCSMQSTKSYYSKFCKTFPFEKCILHFAQEQSHLLAQARWSRLHVCVNLVQPTCIGGLESLQDLWLDLNQLSTLPPEFGQLKSLRFLEASENKLIYLPDTFGSLSSLTDLYLHENLLADLPDSFGNVVVILRILSIVLSIVNCNQQFLA